ncbi:MAG TPA: hypothetical protein VIH91_09150 [Terriglobales bacterium]
MENEARPDSILLDPLTRNTMRIELPVNEGTIFHQSRNGSSAFAL